MDRREDECLEGKMGEWVGRGMERVEIVIDGGRMGR